jgi:hypothetical protein
MLCLSVSYWKQIARFQWRVGSEFLFSRLTPHAYGFIRDHQCGFQRNRSVSDQILYTQQIVEKTWEYNGTVCQLFIYFKKAYDSLRREVLYIILTEFGISRKLVGLITVCLNERIEKIWQVFYSEWPETRRRFITIAFELYLAGTRRTRKGWNWTGRAGFWPMLMMLIYWEKT